MVGGTPQSPPLGVGAAVGLVPVPVPVALADMVAGGMVGAVGGAVGTMGTCIAGGNTNEV